MLFPRRLFEIRLFPVSRFRLRFIHRLHPVYRLPRRSQAFSEELWTLKTFLDLVRADLYTLSCAEMIERMRLGREELSRRGSDWLKASSICLWITALRLTNSDTSVPKLDCSLVLNSMGLFKRIPIGFTSWGPDVERWIFVSRFEKAYWTCWCLCLRFSCRGSNWESNIRPLLDEASPSLEMFLSILWEIITWHIRPQILPSWIGGSLRLAM